jgi:UDP-glucose:(heptosyl)LPS alpha-1,3-glucosyltransferase
MRIAVLSRNFVSTGGGAERYAIAVVERLASDNEVHVFAQTIAHSFPDVRYHVLPMRIERPRWINQLLFAVQAWRATRKGFDIVYSHENVWHGNVQAVHVLPAKHGLFSGRTGMALWIQMLRAATSPRLLAYLWLERMRFAPHRHRRIVAASGALAAAMRQSYPATANVMTVIAPGVDMPDLRSARRLQLQSDARKSLGLPQTGTCVLFVGNDFRKKGLPALIRAFARLGDLPADMYMAVVGNQIYRDAMQALAVESGVAGRVHFLGSLEHVDMAYRAADCLVHPTLQDSFAMVVLEAMAYGLPTIVSKAPFCGIAEDLTDGKDSILIADPHDAGEISRHLRTVLTDAAQRDTLIANGLAFANRHTWQAAGDAHRQLFAEVLA